MSCLLKQQTGSNGSLICLTYWVVKKGNICFINILKHICFYKEILPLTLKDFCILPTVNVEVFRMNLRINIDYFPKNIARFVFVI